ncbi:HIG1 domain family member 2A, mitochondrial-like [Homarus americanus]|uniref:HIG1 domain family member 2A-like n=1 Tax=Homarus americanus TaxID=6706 RepID=A0A8J5N7Q8_HOMAM|nr:HIG1 domain family member 2A, mitochondrial-like [Homarus americanus]XP_042210552.1 HIG1 domain family member 2A, mitochondrial-like [Homarus americanus]KAG7175310.1 HIG1 domain family member 2A-like [Homarus americanus]
MADDKNELAEAVKKTEFTELDWLTLRSDLGEVQLKTHETSGEKFKRKFYENPFVPIGCGLTTAALCYGLWSFSTGKRKSSQNMMRLRVFAQGFTIVALMLGIVKTSLK